MLMRKPGPGYLSIGGLEEKEARPVEFRCRVCIVGLACLALALGYLSSVQSVTAHSDIDPDIEELTEELTKDPHNVELLIRRGQTYRTNGQYLESLQDLDQAWLLDRENRLIILERAMTLSALGRDEEAEAALNDFLRDPSHSKRVFALAERAYIRARTGRTALAIADFTSTIELQPTIELFLTRGQLQESLGQFEAAAAGYQEGLSTLGNAILLKKALIRVLLAQNQIGPALALVNQEAARSSVKTPWHLQKAEILTKMGQPEESRRAHAQALSEANRVLKKRSTAMQLLARAKVFHAMGQVEEAKRDLREALQKAPRFTEADDLLKKLESQ
jgi:tetratricopeptide (TPR) repeat protein